MGSWRSVAAAAGLLCLLWHLASSKDVQVDCYNDYVTTLVCRWKVDAITNCTAEFKVLYQRLFFAEELIWAIDRIIVQHSLVMMLTCPQERAMTSDNIARSSVPNLFLQVFQ
ncbi:interleukin-4 receptor subunit alpha [Pituophis catenifer annectens]|uniref:interleukin-4 receptor subunit alpha n=1 Tax=Pituophis catenifer annectens TaxID=94852 RepID=UPI0039965977